MIQQQTFSLPTSFALIIKLEVIFFVGILIGSLLVPIIKTENEILFSIAIVCGMVSCFILYHHIKTLRKTRYATISVDSSGIWYDHLGKASSFVPWSKVAYLKRKQALQRLELLDSNNNMLIRAEYQLKNIEQLQDIIIQKTHVKISYSQRIFAKKASYYLMHAFFIAILFGTMFLGNFFIIKSAIIISLVSYRYLTSVTKITLTDSCFILGYPFRETVIHFTDVTDIIAVRRLEESSIFQIGICVEGKEKPYQFTKLGIDDLELLVILRQAVKPCGK